MVAFIHNGKMNRETYIAEYIAQHFLCESPARQLEIMHGLWVFFDALNVNRKPTARFDSEPQKMVESESRDGSNSATQSHPKL